MKLREKLDTLECVSVYKSKADIPNCIYNLLLLSLFEKNDIAETLHEKPRLIHLGRS